MRILNVIVLFVLVMYAGYQKNEASEYNKIAVDYYNHYCQAESLLIQANLSDPIVLEFRANAKKGKVCNGFVIQ